MSCAVIITGRVGGSRVRRPKVADEQSSDEGVESVAHEACIGLLVAVACIGLLVVVASDGLRWRARTLLKTPRNWEPELRTASTTVRMPCR